MAKPTQKEDALTAPQPGGLSEQIPDYMIRTPLGAENINPEDARIPRLSVAQSNSPQTTEGDPQFIEGLKAGDIFNDLTGHIYGRDPIQIIVVKADRPRWIEFDEDLKVVDIAVPAGDKRTEFRTVDGERLPPIATMFRDYVVLVGPERLPMALSFKGTSLKTAERLNGLIRLKPVPIWACRYELTPTQMKKDKMSWYIFTVRQVGILGPGEKEIYLEGEKWYAIFEKKKVEYDQTADRTDAVPAGQAEL